MSCGPKSGVNMDFLEQERDDNSVTEEDMLNSSLCTELETFSLPSEAQEKTPSHALWSYIT